MTTEELTSLVDRLYTLLHDERGRDTAGCIMSISRLLNELTNKWRKR